MSTAPKKIREPEIEAGDSELPEGWADAALSELIVHALGGSWGTDSANKDKDSVQVRVIRGTEFKNWFSDKGNTAAERYVDSSSLAKRRLIEGDLIVEISGGGPDQPVGRTIMIDADTVNRSGQPVICSNFCRQVRLSREVSPEFVNAALQFQYKLGMFNQFQTETTNIRNLNFPDFISNIRIPIPPPREQQRIIGRVKNLRNQTDRATGRLRRTALLLKHFRQAVLTAACLGKLTEDWRTTHPSSKPAALLLERIALERAKKGTHKANRSDQTADCEIPETWVWVVFGEVIGELRNGIPTKPEIEPPGKPMLRISAVRAGKVTLEDYRYLRIPGDFSEYRLRSGDLLFTRYNGSLELLGVCGMVRDLRSELLYPDKLMRVRFDHPWILPAYAEIFFCSPQARGRMTEQSKSSAGQQGVSGASVKAQPFALPPINEQNEIVRRVEALFKLADAIEKRVAAATLRAERLTQAVLAKAFRGELVPTEAELAKREGREYEPASRLLERITSAKRREDVPGAE
jgi:type I restriction enzyme, S subunit